MSEDEETFYVSMKVKDMPVNPVPSVKLMCMGGCGDEVWADKKLERLWCKVPVLCLKCGLEKMDSARKEEILLKVATESLESLMRFLLERNKVRKS